MSFKFSTNFLLPYVRKPAKYGGRGSIGLDATPTVLIHICHPVHIMQSLFKNDFIDFNTLLGIVAPREVLIRSSGALYL